MLTVVDKLTGKVLYASYQEIETDEVISIIQVCEIQTENEIFYNFETKEFYVK